ncbi:MAG: DUF3828 domain-containing protein [Anaerolineae bacterium]|jgi:uncharacterized protein YceK
MSRNRFGLSVLGVLMVLAVIVSGCASVRALAGGKTAAPEEVVESFYDWYLQYPGNVIADGAHRSSQYLTEGFVEKVDAGVASFEKGGYDPFLCAQDVPGDLIVGEAEVSGNQARVTVQEVWNPGTEFEFVKEVVVELEMMGGGWTIANIICR